MIRILKKMSHLAILKKFQGFFPKKIHLFFQKKTSFVLRNRISVAFYGTCGNLVKKIITFRNVSEHREGNWQTSGKKFSIWEEDFPSIFYKNREKE